MKKLIPILLLLFIVGCTKVDIQPPQTLDLGKVSTSTAINKITKNNNTLTVEFYVTPGAKYSVQFIPFNGDKPSKIEGFTADNEIVTKTYDLSSLKRMDYNMIFIDVKGNETKYPVQVN